MICKYRLNIRLDRDVLEQLVSSSSSSKPNSNSWSAQTTHCYSRYFYKLRFVHTNNPNHRICDMCLKWVFLRNFRTTRPWRVPKQQRLSWRTCTPTPSTTSGWPPSRGGGRGPPPPSSPSEPSSTVSRTRRVFSLLVEKNFLFIAKTFPNFQQEVEIRRDIPTSVGI